MQRIHITPVSFAFLIASLLLGYGDTRKAYGTPRLRVPGKSIKKEGVVHRTAHVRVIDHAGNWYRNFLPEKLGLHRITDGNGMNRDKVLRRAILEGQKLSKGHEITGVQIINTRFLELGSELNGWTSLNDEILESFVFGTKVSLRELKELDRSKFELATSNVNAKVWASNRLLLTANNAIYGYESNDVIVSFDELFEK